MAKQAVKTRFRHLQPNNVQLRVPPAPSSQNTFVTSQDSVQSHLGSQNTPVSAVDARPNQLNLRLPISEVTGSPWSAEEVSRWISGIFSGTEYANQYAEAFLGAGVNGDMLTYDLDDGVLREDLGVAKS